MLAGSYLSRAIGLAESIEENVELGNGPRAVASEVVKLIQASKDLLQEALGG